MKKKIQKNLIICCVFFLIFNNIYAQNEKADDYFDLGVFAFEDLDYKGAIYNFNKALDLDKKNPLYYQYIGKTYLQLDNYKKANIFLTKAFKINPDLPEIIYDIALLKYQKELYSDAAELFIKVYNEDSKNVLAAYHAGICLFKIEKYKKAQKYFLLVAEKSPNIRDNAYYYAGICFQKTGNIDKAISFMVKVRDSSKIDNLKKYAQKWIDALYFKKQKDRKFNVFAHFAFLYDDNVRAYPEDEYYSEKKEDLLIRAYFKFDYKIKQDDNLIFGSAYSHFQTLHFDLNEFDVIGSILNLYASYKIDKNLLYSFKYSPSYNYLDYSKYIARQTIENSLLWTVNDELTTKFTYKYYIDNYFENSGRDANTNDIAIDLRYRIKNYVLFAQFNAVDTSSSYIEYNYEQLKTDLGLQFNIFEKLNVMFNTKYYDKRFESYELENKRKDIKLDTELRLFIDFKNKFTAGIEYQHTKNNSNNNAYDYRRNIIGILLSTRF